MAAGYRPPRDLDVRGNQRRRSDGSDTASRRTEQQQQQQRSDGTEERRRRKREAVGSGRERYLLPRLIAAVGGTDRVWECRPELQGPQGSGTAQRRGRYLHWLRHDGMVEARGVSGERLVRELDEVWQRDADALDEGNAYESHVSAWRELCARRRKKLEDLDWNVDSDTFASTVGQHAALAVAADGPLPLRRRLLEIEDEEFREMERRRIGRADAMACIVPERSDVLSVTSEVRAALHRMGRSDCKILQLHYAEHVEDRKILERKVRDAALAMADLAFGKGCADFIGTVNMSAELLSGILDEGLPIATAQFSMNIAERRASSRCGEASNVMEICRDNGIVPLAHGALLGGLLREGSILRTVKDRRGRRRYASRLDVNSAGRARGWAQLARVSKSPMESLQHVLHEMWKVSREMATARDEEGGRTVPPISSVALAWVLAEMEFATTAGCSSYATAERSTGGGGDNGGTGCLIVGHGRREDYFNSNRRAAEELFLDDGAAARLREVASAAPFAALPGDVYDWERGLL